MASGAARCELPLTCAGPGRPGVVVNPQAAGSEGDVAAPGPGSAVRVAVDAPIWGELDYAAADALAAGSVVRVPLGRKIVCGVALGPAPQEQQGGRELRPLEQVCDALPPLGADWIELLRFASGYYQRPLGELMAAALPGWLREHDAGAVRRRWQAASERWAGVRFELSPAGREQLPLRLGRRSAALWRLAAALGLRAPGADPAGEADDVAADAVASGATLDESAARRLHPRGAAVLREWLEQGWLRVAAADAPAPMPALPALHEEQRQAVEVLAAQPGFGVQVLFGVTGSGKTEVYLRAAQQVLERDPRAQVLVLTPEINLTPQLLRRFAERFPAYPLAVLHSGLAEAERFDHWAAAHAGHARIVLGTRLAALASLPHLALIVVDEEHDASYKQQEGARYSARDLAVWRARQRDVPVLLGS
ncbi:MAG: DEAD/DEAH box helicase, partial [Betaproteobacteria bacterium]|nr:DEAD/DEAH box helicase [Betaproteobacteria bacterium]